MKFKVIFIDAVTIQEIIAAKQLVDMVSPEIVVVPVGNNTAIQASPIKLTKSAMQKAADFGEFMDSVGWNADVVFIGDSHLMQELHAIYTFKLQNKK